MLTHLLYLHGFRSSPLSNKAQQVSRWVQAFNAQHPSQTITWACPQLPDSPAAAMALIDQITAAWPREHMAVIGSSLGGYYATAAVKQRGCKGWLINPAVAPARDLAAYMRQATPQHPPEDDHYFQAAFVDELAAINPHPFAAPFTGHHALGVLIAKGDEVLDWREMHAAYAQVPGIELHLLEGGDHTASDFAVHLPKVLQFLGGHAWLSSMPR